MKKNYFVTTPIYYPSGKLHVGHAYTTIAGDVFSRYMKSRGNDVYYLTGTDEHGQKIAEVAGKNLQQPKDYLDEEIAKIKALWKKLDIEYDHFNRTTDKNHKIGVQRIFNQLKMNGDIYLGSYEGGYCVSCETFYTNIQAKQQDYKCISCGKKIEIVQEECYFLKCSKYKERLLDGYNKNGKFIKPDSRKNEIINSFMQDDLPDLAISRSNFTGGIPVPGDEKQVIYVWIDALSNYITALGYGEEKSNFEHYGNDAEVIHLVGKEIIRFHVIYWPIILMSLGEKLPDKIFAHGGIVMDNVKMSKSLGNTIYPEPFIERYGSDSLRYYLMREIPFGNDGNFSANGFLKRYNSDLVNDLGNLIHRTVTLCDKYELIDFSFETEDCDGSLWNNYEQFLGEIDKQYQDFNLHTVLEKIGSQIANINKYFDRNQPGIANEEQTKNIFVLKNVVEQIKNISFLIAPYMPNTMNKINVILGIDKKCFTGDQLTNHNTKYHLKTGKHLFTRLIIEEELKKLEPSLKISGGV